MRFWKKLNRPLLVVLLLPLLATAQLKEFEVSEMERPDVAVVQANTEFPDDALVLVYSSLDGLQFRSSMGGIDKQSYNPTAGRYEILVRPVKQMLFVAKPGFIEMKLATINPNAKDVLYHKVEKVSKDEDIRSLRAAVDSLVNIPKEGLSIKTKRQLFHKYIVIDRILTDNEFVEVTRRRIRDNLQDRVVVVDRTAGDRMPNELKNDKWLGVHLVVEFIPFGMEEVRIKLLDPNGSLIDIFNATASTGSAAMREAMASVSSYMSEPHTIELERTTPQPSVNEGKAIPSSAITQRLLDLKKLFDAGVLSEDEYNTTVDELKSSILETSSLSVKNNTPIEIGQIHAGGVVFQTDGEGHGLVVAFNDLGVVSWKEAMAESASYDNGNFTDWYLPSEEELMKLYTHRNAVNQSLSKEGGAKLASAWYWSRSQKDDENSLLLNFINAEVKTYEKSFRSFARAIRAF